MLFNFFLLIRAFLAYLRLASLMIVFLDLFLQDKPILWQASTSCGLTVISVSESIDDTVLSKSLSYTVSGIPDNTKLFLLPYWLR